MLNASPIIYLCKCGLARSLKGLKPSFRFVTTPEVYDEVYTRGLERAVEEAEQLKELFDGGIIEVVPPKSPGKIVAGDVSSSGVHPGEASVINLAAELEGTAIIDDRRAKRVARILGVQLSGTPGIVIEFVRARIISKREAKDAVERMVDSGWYCSAKVFSGIIESIDRA